MVKSYARRNSRKVSVRRSKKSTALSTKNVEKVVSRMIMKKTEPKHKSYAHSKVELYHNGLTDAMLNGTVMMPSEGTGDDERIGDRINVGGFYLRMLCGQKEDRPNCTWRFTVVRVPKGTTINYNTVFDNITGNVLLDNPNRDVCKVLKTFTYKKVVETLTRSDGSGWNARELTFPIKIWVPYKKTYKFQTNGSLYHDDHDIRVFINVYDAYGTLTTDNIAYIQMNSTMYYKDP